MEKKSRTNTIESSPPSPQEAAASLDPLIQPIHDQEGEPVYVRRKSSIFYVPASITNETDDDHLSAVQRCFTYMERFSGILYALLGSFLGTCSTFVLKQLDIHILDAIIIRSFVQSLISIGYIFYKGYHPIPDSHRISILIRSLFAASGTISFFYCLSLLPLPDLTTFRYTQVVWTAVIAMIVFRERLTIATIIACILTLIGVACVAQPTFLFSPSNGTSLDTTKSNSQTSLIGTLIALACALSISMSIVLNKKLIQQKVRQSIIMLYFLLTSLILLLIIRVQYWIFSSEFNFKKAFLTKDFLLASMITILQFIPMVISQKALKREHPSIITVVQSSDILFALILQNVFTPIRTNLLALIGSILVLTSIFIVGGHKLWLDRRNRTCLPQK